MADDDNRIVYGATCSWWDSISEVGRLPSGLPCCPHCRGVLYEIYTEAQWWELVDDYAVMTDSPGYRATVEWARGRCFTDHDALREAYAACMAEPM
jgi:hypothetical protein